MLDITEARLVGQIGHALARRARAIGLLIHNHDWRRLPQAVMEALGASYWESHDRMLARMDVVSIRCPHAPATYHLLSARRLRLLRREAIVINTAGERSSTRRNSPACWRLVESRVPASMSSRTSPPCRSSWCG